MSEQKTQSLENLVDELMKLNDDNLARRALETSDVHVKAVSVGWIDVHDSLPEPGVPVIGLYAMGEVAVFTMESYETFKKMNSAEYCTVSHWMPMPELPEE